MPLVSVCYNLTFLPNSFLHCLSASDTFGVFSNSHFGFYLSHTIPQHLKVNILAMWPEWVLSGYKTCLCSLQTKNFSGEIKGPTCETAFWGIKSLLVVTQDKLPIFLCHIFPTSKLGKICYLSCLVIIRINGINTCKWLMTASRTK